LDLPEGGSMTPVLQRRLDRLEQRGDSACVHVEIVRFGDGSLPDPVPCASCTGIRLSYVRPNQ
jgi:hypothetical protein